METLPRAAVRVHELQYACAHAPRHTWYGMPATRCTSDRSRPQCRVHYKPSTHIRMNSSPGWYTCTSLPPSVSLQTKVFLRAYRNSIGQYCAAWGSCDPLCAVRMYAVYRRPATLHGCAAARPPNNKLHAYRRTYVVHANAVRATRCDVPHGQSSSLSTDTRVVAPAALAGVPPRSPGAANTSRGAAKKNPYTHTHTRRRSARAAHRANPCVPRPRAPPPPARRYTPCPA